jgi:hypothetical protein
MNRYGEPLTGAAEMNAKTKKLELPGVPFAPLTIHLFCDTLELEHGQKIDAGGKRSFNIQVFARRVKVPPPTTASTTASTAASTAASTGTGKPAGAAPVLPPAKTSDNKSAQTKPPASNTAKAPETKPNVAGGKATAAPKSIPEPPALDVTLPKGSRLLLAIPDRPEKFSVRLAIPNEETMTKLWPRDGTYGISFWEDEGKVKWQLHGPPSGSVENIDVSVLVRKDGTVKDTRLLNDYFPRLLQMQMLIASAYIERDTELAKKLLAFITLCRELPPKWLHARKGRCLTHFIQSDVRRVTKHGAQL